MAETSTIDRDTEVDNANLERWSALPGLLEDAKSKAEDLREQLARVNSELEAMAAEGDTSLNRNLTVIQRHDLAGKIRELNGSARAMEDEHRRLTTSLDSLSEPEPAETTAGIAA